MPVSIHNINRSFVLDIEPVSIHNINRSLVLDIEPVSIHSINRSLVLDIESSSVTLGRTCLSRNETFNAKIIHNRMAHG